MAIVYLPASFQAVVGGRQEVSVSAPDIRAVIDELGSLYPDLIGRFKDEQGALRPHVKIFVNGESVGLEDKVQASDEIRILPAISGGSDEAELLVGTRKGLFVLHGPRGAAMEVAGRSFVGLPVEYAIRDPRTGTYYASVTDWHFGPRVFMTDDPTGEWEQTSGPVFPEDADAAVERIWTIEPGVEDGVIFAGVAPGALFRSGDGGRTWELNRGLWDLPQRPDWGVGAGGQCLHSIVQWEDPLRMAIAVSAAGVWHTEDGGASWYWGSAGLVPEYMPEDAREGATALCVHDMKLCPSDPDTLYIQFHGGVYRSDDAGKTWTDIGDDNGLPSDFGFPLVIDHTDSRRAFVIPLVGAEDRTTPDGKVRVYETTNGGASWEPRGSGLPDHDAFLTILRQAFCGDDRGGSEIGLYFGATSGEVFGSADGGRSWLTVASHLPPVLSVRCAY